MSISVPTERAVTSTAEFYQALEQQARALLEGEMDLTANAANLSALVYHSLADVNWAGFYFLKGDQLVLGPFQGQPACVRIEVGKGVCGLAALRRETVIVPDVHEFPDHIACDSASNSEMVVPVIKEGGLIGVLDLDSPKFSRFDDEDAAGLDRIVAVLVEMSEIRAELFEESTRSR